MMTAPRILACLLFSFAAHAETYVLPPDGEDVVGDLSWAPVLPEDTLADIALRHDIGFRQLLQANPGTDPWLPAAGSSVVLPHRLILPRTRREGIVINVAEMRLYFYPPKPEADGTRRVMVYPVAIGRDDWRTPLGLTRIRAKVRDPVWYPPESIRAEHAAEGDPLPKAVPPGPDNPLGPLALRLDLPRVLIHGTNRPYGLGMPVTHGCIRMSADDLRELFERVKPGTPVMFIDEPYKLGREQGQWLLEAHAAEDSTHAVERVASMVQQAGLAPLDADQISKLLQSPTGMPVPLVPAEKLPVAETTGAGTP